VDFRAKRLRRCESSFKLETSLDPTGPDHIAIQNANSAQ